MNNFPNLTLTELSSAIIFVNILLSFILGLAIAIVYQKTHRGLSYSRSYVESMVMMSVLSAIAMMILGNNLVRALGILGVFTLIRFRTIIKDTKDATYLFFALAINYLSFPVRKSASICLSQSSFSSSRNQSRNFVSSSLGKLRTCFQGLQLRSC